MISHSRTVSKFIPTKWRQFIALRQYRLLFLSYFGLQFYNKFIGGNRGKVNSCSCGGMAAVNRQSLYVKYESGELRNLSYSVHAHFLQISRIKSHRLYNVDFCFLSYTVCCFNSAWLHDGLTVPSMLHGECPFCLFCPKLDIPHHSFMPPTFHLLNNFKFVKHQGGTSLIRKNNGGLHERVPI